MAPRTKSATVTVLTDFDLVEDIILRLPIREVLLIKRVSKSWKRIYDESIRIQKALFLLPAFEEKIYYPNCSKSTWYLAPSRSELIANGFVSEAAEQSDGDITPTNSPRVKPTGMDSEVKSMKGGVAKNGKHNTQLRFTIAGKSMPADDGNAGNVLVGSKDVSKTYEHTSGTYGKQAVGGGSSGTGESKIDGATGENTCKTVVLYKVEDGNVTGNVTKKKVHFASANINIFGQKVKGEADFVTDTFKLPGKSKNFGLRLKIPPCINDGKMMVSRVTPPTINPFCELFIERYFRGSRGGFFPSDPNVTPDQYINWTGELIVLPQIKLPDGTTYGRSSKTRAVQRKDASWRKMHPFSAITASIEVECFDFGAFEVYCDWGMLAGSMMDQLGEHWSNTCPECCILDFWFSEFIKQICLTDQSHLNRGKHGVRKLPGGLNNTGWEVLAKLSAAKVRVTNIKDRIRPF